MLGFLSFSSFIHISCQISPVGSESSSFGHPLTGPEQDIDIRSSSSFDSCIMSINGLGLFFEKEKADVYHHLLHHSLDASSLVVFEIL